MAFFLNKFDTSPQIAQAPYSKRNPGKKILISGIILLIIIAISIFILLNYDPSNPNAEKDLTVLHERYTKGEKLDKKEFALYCLLLEKIWKKHLKACYCKDGISNPTPGIDWSNPPDSPESLGTEWIDVTHPIAKEKSNRLIFRNRNTGEEIAFEIGRMRKDGSRLPDHWHRPNPKSVDDSDYYLDECGNPIRKSHDDSHIWIKGLTPYGE